MFNKSMAKKLLAVMAIFIATMIAGCCNMQGDSPCTFRRPMPTIDPVVELKRNGVQIIQTGEAFNIVLPSDKLFYQDSANFLPKADKILHPLALFLHDFETTAIKVMGFTDNTGNPLRNKVLSEKQAQQVVDYLTEDELDARIIYGVGYGQNLPIADNSNPKGRAQNRRVEVRFREVIVPPV